MDREKITLSKNAPHGLHLPYEENSGEGAPGVDLRPGDSADVGMEHLQEGTRNELVRLEKLGMVAFGAASPTYVAPETATAKPAPASETAALRKQIEELTAAVQRLTAGAAVPPPIPDTKPARPPR